MPRSEKILLGHGSGGQLSSELLAEVVLPAFGDVQPTDGAVLEPPAGRRLVFTTDSFVVRPRFFPGGNIGDLAINGTVNDLAMMGANPVWLSCAFVLEEGLPLSEFSEICRAMRRAADQAGVRIVTGDTKVVGRGEADGVYINTAGIGFADPDLVFGPGKIAAGDEIIISGGLGEHGVAVMAARLGVTFQPELPSDTRPLWPQVAALLGAGLRPGVMRDITRGGLASVVCELARDGAADFLLEESGLRVDARVRKACEIWGFDPLHVACEGRFLAVLPPAQTERALALLGPEASRIGRVEPGPGAVWLHTAAGGTRPVKPLPAELLPRIC